MDRKKNKPQIHEAGVVNIEGHAQKINYETHYLEDKELPVIFHLDTIRGNGEFFNWHDNVEILYCVGGEGRIFCNGTEYRMQKGDLVVINSNFLHGAASEDTLQYYCLIVDQSFLEENKFRLEEQELACHLSDPETAGLFEEVIAEMNKQDDYRDAGIRTAVLRLMLRLCRCHSVTGEDGGRGENGIHDNIKTAIGYIKTRYSQKITLEEVADRVGLSKYYFAREFKKATGMTLVTFVNTYRCRNAIQLLTKKHYSVHEAAQKCGFENDSYFSKTFKSLMGYLPSELVDETRKNL